MGGGLAMGHPGLFSQGDASYGAVYQVCRYFLGGLGTASCLPIFYEYTRCFQSFYIFCLISYYINAFHTIRERSFFVF